MTDADLPRHVDLPVREGAPAGSSWGLWGDHDVFGTLNLQTPARALAASRSIRSGRWFALNLDLGLPDPPMFGRAPLVHEVTGTTGSTHDDVVREWNTQSSAQWDGFRHFPHRVHGYYGGIPDEITASTTGPDGASSVARCSSTSTDGAAPSGGRCGTASPSRSRPPTCWRASRTRARRSRSVTSCCCAPAGWLTTDRSMPMGAAYADARAPHPGIAGHDLPAVLWDLHISAIAADSPVLEVNPAQPGWGFLHAHALPLLGLPLGELWDLDELAADCAATRTYDAFFTSAPIHLRRGVASPPNAIAVR